MLGAGVLAGALALLGLWWVHAPAVRTQGDWLTAAGRLTGLLAGWALLVALVLMARIPALEAGVGADRLARWHAAAGRYSTSLVAAHAFTIVLGYAAGDRSGVWAEGVDVVAHAPDVLAATVGTGLLFAAAGLSVRAARARVSYETWYHVHLVTYLAVGLSFAHVLSAGADFRAGGTLGWAARTGWTVAYAGAAAAVGWYRWACPLVGAWRHRLAVAAVYPESPGVVSVVVAGRDLDRLGAVPGQFFRWRFLTGGLWWQSHPYSLSAAPTGTRMRITVKDLGDASGALARLRPGTRVVAEGPYGAMTLHRRRGHGVLLLAGGIGITPLRAMLDHLAPHAGPVTLLYRASGAADVVFAAELDALARAGRVQVRYLIGPPGSPADPFVAGRLAALVPGLAERDVFVCGPEPFMVAAAAALTAAGVPRDRVYLEQFSF